MVLDGPLGPSRTTFQTRLSGSAGPPPRPAAATGQGARRQQGGEFDQGEASPTFLEVSNRLARLSGGCFQTHRRVALSAGIIPGQAGRRGSSTPGVRSTQRKLSMGNAAGLTLD